ncbi:hypothetical protein [Streptomyces nanshensis]|uniref:Uncharacterized protein n=1 Tax=Streptomyces nanshensis TaxID=518642 RepID=A0A1E7KZM6_9ACTN|nr:hypothetical protein [Streptomyces nanshensis]OEV09331.1 hypothetical protein AN218_23185 [Streptomyces nanshensis]
MSHSDDPVDERAGAPDRDTAASARPSPPKPKTPADWRDVLRKEEPPEEYAELPWRKRRRAKRSWRSARRDARARWIAQERRKTPTSLAVPALAIMAAAAVLTASWLWPDEDHTPGKPRPKPTITAPDDATRRPSTSPTPSASPSAASGPESLAKAFAAAYTARRPLQDGSHKASVDRAAPYASEALIANLKGHQDRDFNKLVASQAEQATPTKIVVSGPTGKDRPAADTSIRRWLATTITLDVEATDSYTYTRTLTLEISRSDTSGPWMVTRVLGVEE